VFDTLGLKCVSIVRSENFTGIVHPAQYTPKHGSLLNMAEIEISVMARQCMAKRMGSIERLETEALAWTEKRNAKKRKVDWQFITTDARIKLKNSIHQSRRERPLSAFQYFPAAVLRHALRTRAPCTVSIANTTTYLLRFDIVVSPSISGRKLALFHKLFEVIDCLRQSLFQRHPWLPAQLLLRL
jgi:hypothetical protein